MTDVRIFESLDDFAAATGTLLGTSGTHEITQSRVDAFADATDDHQWIHVDEERAATGPFGSTIAHGFLTLSLIPLLGSEIFEVRGLSMRLNYGLERVRFPSPVTVGSRLRATARLVSTERATARVRAVVEYVMTVEDADKPACIAESVVLMAEQ